MSDTSVIIVKNIWMEDLFKWFYEHVMDSCGDGASVIVCKNYVEASDMFIEWWKQNELQKIKDNCTRMGYECKNEEFPHPRSEYNNTVNFHDGNENFMFASSPINLNYHDYNFLVEEDCESCENSEKYGINKKILAWK